MESINPKLLEALKQRNININFRLSTNLSDTASKSDSLSVKSSESRGFEQEIPSPGSRSNKRSTSRPGTASYDTDNLKFRKEVSPSSLSRPTTAGGDSGKFSSTMSSGFKIRPTSAKDMIDNFDSMNKTATSGFKRLKEGSKTMNGWKLNAFSNNANDIVEEEFEDEFLRDLDELNGQRLSELLLVDESKLGSVKSLEIKVDLTCSSLNSAGELLTSLVELKLNGSIMKSLRDIGNAFQNLEILWVSNCGLKDLAGANSFPQLKELYASYNSIEDVSDLMFKVSLNVIDLEGNDIKDIENLQNLMGLDQLTTLSVAGNPFADKDPDYRKKVAEFLPQLQIIDDEKVEVIHASPSKKGKVVEGPQESEGQFEEIIEKIGKLEIMNKNELRQSVRDLLKNTNVEEPDEEKLITMTVKKKHNKASNIETTAKRLRAKEASNPAINENLANGLSKRPSSAKPTSKIPVKANFSAQTNIFSAASDLTHTSDEVFSGNPLKAMRHKRQNTFINKLGGDDEKVTQKNIFELFNEFSHFERDNEAVQEPLFDQEAKNDDVENINPINPKLALTMALNRTNSQHSVGDALQAEPSENPVQVITTLFCCALCCNS